MPNHHPTALQSIPTLDLLVQSYKSQLFTPEQSSLLSAKGVWVFGEDPKVAC